MKVRYAVDMIVPGRFGPEGEGDLHLRVSKAMKKLHGAFSGLGKCFAIDLPMYGTASSLSVIRVFAESREALESLVGEVDERFDQINVRIGTLREIPDNFEGKWVVCRRYRIPSRKKEIGMDKSFRAARMLYADQQRMAHFTLRSGSNGNAYRIYVQREEVGSSVHANNDLIGRVDAYGLSSAEAPVILPVL